MTDPLRQAQRAPMREALEQCLGCVTAAEAEGLHELIMELRGSNDSVDRLIDLIDRRLLWVREYAVPALAVPQPPVDGVRDGMTKAMKIVGNMRQSEAGLFDAKHSGQRGCDRSDALYDAYQAIKAALPGCGDPNCKDPACTYGTEDEALRSEVRQLRLDNARLRDEAFLRSQGISAQVE